MIYYTRYILWGCNSLKYRLYQHTRRFARVFCLSILCVTVSMLALRLTVFSDMAIAEPKGLSDIISGSQEVRGGGSTFTYELNSAVTLENSEAKANVLIRNLSTDGKLMSVDYRLAGTNESIYFTGLINPGASIDATRLDSPGRALSDGEYPCNAQITVYDPDSLEQIGETTQDVVVHVGAGK